MPRRVPSSLAGLAVTFQKTMQSFLNQALAGQRPVFAVCRRTASPNRSIMYYTTRMQSHETRLVLFAEHEHARVLAASLEDHYKVHGRFPSSAGLQLRADAISRDWDELFTTVRELRLDEFVRQTHGADVPMAIAYDVTWTASHAMYKTCNLRMKTKPLDRVAFLEKRMAADAVTGTPPLNAGASATGPLGSIVPALLLAKKPERPPQPPTAAALDHVWLLMLMLMRIMFARD